MPESGGQRQRLPDRVTRGAPAQGEHHLGPRTGRRLHRVRALRLSGRACDSVSCGCDARVLWSLSPSAGHAAGQQRLTSQQRYTEEGTAGSWTLAEEHAEGPTRLPLRWWDWLTCVCGGAPLCCCCQSAVPPLTAAQQRCCNRPTVCYSSFQHTPPHTRARSLSHLTNTHLFSFLFLFSLFYRVCLCLRFSRVSFPFETLTVFRPLPGLCPLLPALGSSALVRPLALCTAVPGTHTHTHTHTHTPPQHNTTHTRSLSRV